MTNRSDITKILAVSFLLYLAIGTTTTSFIVTKGLITTKNELSFDLYTLIGDDTSFAGGEMIKEYLKDIGIKIDHSGLLPASFRSKSGNHGYFASSSDYDNGVAPINETRSYDLIYYSESSNPYKPTDIFQLCHTKNDYRGGTNLCGIHNSSLDIYLDFIVNGSADQIQYFLYQQQAIVAEEVPYIHIAYLKDAIPIRNGMEGLVLTPHGMLSDNNPLSICNFHNTTNLPSSRNGLEWVMRYFRGVRATDPEGLLYYEAMTSQTIFIDRLLWESLVIVNETGHIIPWLAESYTISTDHLQYSFILRDNIKFHDGTIMTPEDVRFSFNYIKSEENDARYTPTSSIKNCTIDGNKVIFNFEHIDNWGIYAFQNLIILPKHIFETVPYNDQTWHDLSNKTTKIGSGPYKFDEVEASDSPGWWLFERHNDYWFTGANPNCITSLEPISSEGGSDPTIFKYPRMERFIIRVILATHDTIRAFTNGAIDLTRYTSIDVNEGLKNYPSEINMVVAPSVWRRILLINNRIKPLNDKYVRQAIAYAIDYESIVVGAEGGNGIAVFNQYLPVAIYGTAGWHNPASDNFRFNKIKANQLLDAAGYLDIDNDGIREVPVGYEDTTSTFTTNTGFMLLEIIFLCTGTLVTLVSLQRKRRS